MNRGDIWLAEVGNKTRPVLIVTRQQVIDVRRLVTVAEITTPARGLAAEVEFDHEGTGLDRASVINCDGLHTIARSSLSSRLSTVNDATMDDVSWAINYALGC
jgi:mRNA interferase MazF